MIYALYHNRSETMGLLGDTLKKLGLHFGELHLYKGDGLPRDTHHLTGLIVMGGPMNVDDINEYPFLFEEVRLIEKLLAVQKPVLGICLGAQLIAKALGSKVYPNKHKEVGWHPIERTQLSFTDPIFSRLPQSLEVLHWHGDTFDLPKDAIHLAKSDRCENQAFRYGDNTFGLQFHLEVTPSMVTTWVRSSDGKKDIRNAGMTGKDILQKTPQAFENLKPIADSFFTNYLESSYRVPSLVH